jgi:hypothetical protein
VVAYFLRERRVPLLSLVPYCRSLLTYHSSGGSTNGYSGGGGGYGGGGGGYGGGGGGYGGGGGGFGGGRDGGDRMSQLGQGLKTQQWGTFDARFLYMQQY